MKNRLLIIVVLAILGAVASAAAVSAQGGTSIGVAGTDISIDLPAGGDLPIVGDVLPACSNGSDDDGDGATDLDDPGCKGPLDGDESNESGSGADDGVKVPPITGPGGGADGDGGKDKGSKDEGSDGPGNLPTTGSPFEGDGAKEIESKDQGREAEDEAPSDRKADGSPSSSNPGLSVADFGPAPIGVPNFIIDRFAIPPFLLPIYQACGTQYGIPWQVLASINRIETAFGTNLNVSTAGAVGWMQFLPSTWKAYGVDANGDGNKDPYNPVDAICGAARYLSASGGMDDLRGAIFAYNRADWYVDEVLLYARQYGKLPSGLINSLTGLTEGAHFPVAAKSRYADDISERDAARRASTLKRQSGNVADVVSDSPTRRGIDIFAKDGSPVVAVNDGVVKRVGKNKQLGKFLVLEDAYGNRFTYAGLGSIAETVPYPRQKGSLTAADFKITDSKGNKVGSASKAAKKQAKQDESDEELANTEDARERLFALPERDSNRASADLNGQLDELASGDGKLAEYTSSFGGVLKFDPKTMDAKPLRKGSDVIAGTELGTIGSEADGVASHLHFEIEPAGRGSRNIDPKPILDGWKLLEATAIYRAKGKNPFTGRANVGQILLMSKAQLTSRVLKDPRIEIYECGRQDIQTGQIDRRILASLAYLAERGFNPTVTSLKCGRSSQFTKSGNVSHHVSGNAVDIARLNGIPILGNQGPGSITEAAVIDLLKLQGTMAPAQIITLMELGGPTFAMGDHADHIHLGFNPQYGPGEGRNYSNLLNPQQWDKLLNRIGQIDQPQVPTKPSKFALPGKRASNAHFGE